jgi:hypothetical protein
MSTLHDRATSHNTERDLRSTVPLADIGRNRIGHDRERWVAEAARVGTDWPSVVATALSMLTMVAGLAPEPRRRQ